jgi:uncharacterized iron-regulated protein
MKQFFVWTLIFFSLMAFRSDKPAYRLFDKEGKASTYQDLLQAAKKADIVLFGELHNNPINHWLQLQLAKDLHAALKDKLLMGAEMFEADNQVLMEEYLAGLVKESNFLKEARLWNNYQTDYRPLVELAKAEKLPFIATNIPRRYASLVAREGLGALQGLSPEAKQWLAPLPIEIDYSLSGYANMMQMMHGGEAAQARNFAAAQAVKDATMAHFILKAWKPGQLFLHFNGSYHSDDYQGIMWYLQKQKPSLKILTIASVEQGQLDKLQKDFLRKADFIIATPSDMTKTY